MIIQASLPINASLLVFSTVFLIFYVDRNQNSFPWNKPGCVQECMDTYFEGPVKAKDPNLLTLVRNEFLFPPPTKPKSEPVDIYAPAWSKLVDWATVQENMNEIWKDQPPGIFVEVGAVDGDFMSQTLFLEKNLSWTGLLLEPDPRSFKVLREAGRNAWISPLCVNMMTPGRAKFWLRDLEMDLPDHFIQLLMARSKLEQETLSGDEERGSTIWVTCMPLSTILNAANMTKIDLLTIATGGDTDDRRIRDVLQSKTIDAKMVLIHYPTGRLFINPYPKINGYILDVVHSTIQVKVYIKKVHCKLIRTGQKHCKKIHYYDVEDACSEYLCFNFLTVWTLYKQ